MTCRDRKCLNNKKRPATFVAGLFNIVTWQQLPSYDDAFLLQLQEQRQPS
jgi:hypothetical protein